MNLLTIGLIAGGLYVISKTKAEYDKGATWNNAINYTPYPALFDKAGPWFAFPFKLSNGKLIEESKYYVDWWLDVCFGTNLKDPKKRGGVPKKGLYNSYFFNTLNIKAGKDKEAIQWLWNKNAQLMNNLYIKYITEYFMRTTQEVKVEIIKTLPSLLTEYQEILKKYDVPESQWLTKKDGENIGKTLGDMI